MTEANPHEQITVTDKRRIDPETGEVRHVTSGAARGGPDAVAGGPPEGSAGKTAHTTIDQVSELTADLKRVQADFANYRKRALRDQQAAADRAKAMVVSQFLGVLDDLDRARSHGDLESGPLKSVADKLMSALTGLGVLAFGAEGDDFDPVLHEAVQHEGSGAQDSKPVIGAVLRHGYKLGEQVLRHALVGVVDTLPDEVPLEGADSTAEAAYVDAADASAEQQTADTADNAGSPGEQGAESKSSS